MANPMTKQTPPSGNTKEPPKAATAPTARDKSPLAVTAQYSNGDEDDLEVEMALLAMAEDTGGPMEDVDLTVLSPTEKRALLIYLREHLGLQTRLP